MDFELKQKIALFRYSLIAPLLNNTFPHKTAKGYIEDICSKIFDAPGNLKGSYSPNTIKYWLYCYRKFNIDGLMPKSRSNKDKPRKISKKLQDFIISLKSENPSLSSIAIYRRIIFEGLCKSTDLSLSTVQRFISRNSNTIVSSTHKDRKAFEFEFPNQCWQSDISVGPYININGKKKKTFIVAFLDDASKLILHCQAFLDDSLVSLLSTFKQAISKRGIPKKLLLLSIFFLHS